MLAGHSHKLLEEAARESIERIQLDRRKAPQRLKPLLAYIEENLFNPTLDVNQLKRSCGVRDNSVPIQFHSAVGRPPHGYIEDRRLETACRLLADTNLKIWQISELLGYSSIQVFSRAFSRWSGQRPTLFRKKARHGPDAGGAVGSKTRASRKRFDRSVVATASLRKALDGELPFEEAKTLIERLEKMYSEDGGAEMEDDSEDGAQARGRVARAPQEVETARLKGNAHDRFRAETIWGKLKGQTPDRQQEILAEVTLTSAALFYFLIEKSREIGRAKPADGVKLAELALSSLDSLARSRDDEKLFASLQAQGWIRLATARALASDLHGAEEGFAEAERLLEKGGRRTEVEAELLAYKATLRRDQRRFDEAQELVDRARGLCPEGDTDLSAKILLIQATVHFEEGEPAAATAVLEQAKPLAARSENMLLRHAVYHNLVASYADAGEYEKALELLPAAKELATEHGTGYNTIRCRWLEGLVARGLGQQEEAEGALVDARDAFSDTGDGLNTALVCLDLADLYSRQERFGDLITLCASMTPLTSMLQDHSEALVALQILQSAAEERSITSVMVEEARRALLAGQKRIVI